MSRNPLTQYEERIDAAVTADARAQAVDEAITNEPELIEAAIDFAHDLDFAHTPELVARVSARYLARATFLVERAKRRAERELEDRMREREGA